MSTTERCKMLDTVNKICSGNVDLNLLLHGGQTLHYCQNNTIIETVELYILETKRLIQYGSVIVLVTQIVYLRNTDSLCDLGIVSYLVLVVGCVSDSQ